MFLNFLKLKGAPSGHDLDDLGTFQLHRSIIFSKPALKNIYQSYYEQLVQSFGDDLSNKKIIEIGAGAFNGKDFFPSITTSDVVKNDYVDMVVDATNMPFKNNEIDGIILLHVLHHVKDPEKFLHEASRCLKPGGKLCFIEPYFGPWGSFVYRYLHHEPIYDTTSWKLPEIGGRMTQANVITPYNIIFRDRKLFNEKFRFLEVKAIKLHTCFNYLLTGGLSYINLIHPKMNRMVWKFERLLKPLYKIFGTCMTVVIEKNYENEEVVTNWDSLTPYTLTPNYTEAIERPL